MPSMNATAPVRRIVQSQSISVRMPSAAVCHKDRDGAALTAEPVVPEAIGNAGSAMFTSACSVVLKSGTLRLLANAAGDHATKNQN